MRPLACGDMLGDLASARDTARRSASPDWPGTDRSAATPRRGDPPTTRTRSAGSLRRLRRRPRRASPQRGRTQTYFVRPSFRALSAASRTTAGASKSGSPNSGGRRRRPRLERLRLRGDLHRQERLHLPGPVRTPPAMGWFTGRWTNPVAAAAEPRRWPGRRGLRPPPPRPPRSCPPSRGAPPRGPMSPRPRTAIPSVTTVTLLCSMAMAPSRASLADGGRQAGGAAITVLGRRP